MVNVNGDSKLVLLEAKQFLKPYRVFPQKNPNILESEDLLKTNDVSYFD